VSDGDGDGVSECVSEGYRFLDVGCGNGWVVRAEAGRAGCAVAAGVDGARDMVRKAEALALKALAPGTTSSSSSGECSSGSSGSTSSSSGSSSSSSSSSGECSSGSSGGSGGSSSGECSSGSSSSSGSTSSSGECSSWSSNNGARQEFYHSDLLQFHPSSKFDVAFSMEVMYYLSEDQVAAMLASLSNNIIEKNGLFIFGIDHYLGE
jgi:SAM-dependent methyltransferase